MLTLLAIIVAIIWVAGAVLILWGTQTTSEGGYDNIAIGLTMAVFWPLWLALGIVSALYEIHRDNRNKRPAKPIDRNT